MRDFYVIVAIIGATCSFVMLFVNTFSSIDKQHNHAQTQLDDLYVYRKCIDGYEFVFVHNGYYKSGLSQILENTEIGLRAKVCK